MTDSPTLGFAPELLEPAVRDRLGEPWMTLSFHTAIPHCHSLSFLRDLHSGLAAIAAIFSQNGSVARG
jgi:hypothetical protein